MNQKLLAIVQENAQVQPAWLQKKRSLAVMLEKRFPLAEQQQKWLTGWQSPQLMKNTEKFFLVHEGDDFVALPMAQAVNRYPELLQENLMEKAVRWQDSQLNAIHLALMDAGQFIYVPDKTKLMEPVNLRATSRSSNPHNLIIVGAGARVTISEESSYGFDGPIYAATEILMGTDAQVDFQQASHYKSPLVRQAVHAYQARGSQLNLEGIIPDAQEGYNSFYSFLDGNDTHWNAQLLATGETNQTKVVTQVDGYGENTSAQVNSWGWNNSHLEWGKLTTVDEEPLTLHQKQVIGRPGMVTINGEQQKIIALKSQSEFVQHYLPKNSWLQSHAND